MKRKEFPPTEASVELTEADWNQGFAIELEKQRPKGEPSEQGKNIDWRHFTAYAKSLASFDRLRAQELIKEEDKAAAVNDFNKLAAGNEKNKWWDLPIYAARLKELNWYEPVFSDSDWEQFAKEIQEQRQEQRNENELWQLVFYVSQLNSLGQTKAKDLMQEKDWAAVPVALAKIADSNEENSSLLALEMENNLFKIDVAKGMEFLNPEHINDVIKRAGELKQVGDWWLSAQYLEAGLVARKNLVG